MLDHVHMQVTQYETGGMTFQLAVSWVTIVILIFVIVLVILILDQPKRS